jgi:hypothetical protein
MDDMANLCNLNRERYPFSFLHLVNNKIDRTTPEAIILNLIINCCARLLHIDGYNIVTRKKGIICICNYYGKNVAT